MDQFVVCEGIENIDPTELLRMKKRERYAILTAVEKDRRCRESRRNYHQKKAKSKLIDLGLTPNSEIMIDDVDTVATSGRDINFFYYFSYNSYHGDNAWIFLRHMRVTCVYANIK